MSKLAAHIANSVLMKDKTNPTNFFILMRLFINQHGEWVF